MGFSASDYAYDDEHDDPDITRLHRALDRLGPNLEVADRDTGVDVLLLISEVDYAWDMSWSTLSEERCASGIGEFDSVSATANTQLSGHYRQPRLQHLPVGELVLGRSSRFGRYSGDTVAYHPSPQTNRCKLATPAPSLQRAKPQKDGFSVQAADRYVGSGRANRDRDDDNRSDFSYQENNS